MLLIIFPFQDWLVILFAKLCLNSYGIRVDQYYESNVTRGQGKQKMVREKSGKSQGILWAATAGHPVIFLCVGLFLRTSLFIWNNYKDMAKYCDINGYPIHEVSINR